MKFTNFLLFFLAVVLIAIVTSVAGYTYFPADIQYYLPSFTLEQWNKVHNSLLADPFFQFEPWRAYAKSRITSGDIPLWNPYNGNGTPFLANPQVALFYPLNVLYYILPFNLSLNLISILKIFFMSTFTYFYLRSIKLDSIPSLIGSGLSVLAGFPIMWLLWPHTNVFILFPLLLYLTEKIRAGNNLHRYYVAIAVVYFIGVLGGHPETLFHVGILHFIYSLHRLWAVKKIWFFQMVFAGLGFLLSSFMLVPFFEYVFNSSLMLNRFHSETNYYLPLKGLIYNFIPFILGAPHHEFYKPLQSDVHFQELAGGYVGLFVLVLIVIYLKRFWSLSLVRFITMTIVFILLIVYKIWPFYLLTKLPLISSVANHRLIGFVGFFLAVLFAILIGKIVSSKYSHSYYLKVSKALLLAIPVLSLILLGSYFAASHFFPTQSEKFLPYLFTQLMILLMSTIFFLLSFLLLHKRRMQKMSYLIAAFAILVQSGLFFYNYAKLNKSSTHYPQKEFIKILQTSNNGGVLQVGNLNFPPNINLAYGVSNIQSDDAIGVATYQQAFNNTFRIRNEYRIIDEVDSGSLHEFNVSYVISDYDINYQKENINAGNDRLFEINNNPIVFNVAGNDKVLSQIRLLTANFNRLNNCTFSIVIKEDGGEIYTQELLCERVRDNAYMTITVPDISLRRGASYEMVLRSQNANEDNKVALRGSSRPYLALLYKSHQRFPVVWSKDGVMLFEVPNVQLIEGANDYTVMRDDPEFFSAVVTTDQPTEIRIKKVNYPGWNVYVDNKKVIPGQDYFFTVPVREEEHLIELKYEPLSFRIGVSVSLIAVVILLVYFLRHESKNFRKISKLLRSVIARHKIGPTQVILTFTLGIIISSALFLIVSFLPLRFGMRYVDGINWYTANSYPRHKDQFFFYIATFLFLAVPIFTFLFYIWKVSRRKKK